MRYAVEKGSGDDGCAEGDEAGADACSARFGSVAQAENAGDACGERAAVGGEAERRSGAPFFHGGESARVAEMIAASGDSDVVAAVFALGAHALIQPPNRRMEKQDGLDKNLEEIDEGIEAANVREFVSDDGFDLIFGEASERANGKHDDRFKPADDGGRVKPATFAEMDDARDTEARLELTALCEKGRCDGDGGCAAETFEVEQAARSAKREEKNAREPEFDEEGQRLPGERLGGGDSGNCRLSCVTQDCLLREDEDRRCGVLCCLHRGLRIEEQREGDGDGRDHREKREDADDVSSGGAAEERERDGRDCRERESLPDEMEQRPAEGAQSFRCDKGG